MKYAKYLAIILSIFSILLAILGAVSSGFSSSATLLTAGTESTKFNSDSMTVMAFLFLLIFICLFQSMLKNDESFESYPLSSESAYSEKILISVVPFTVLFLVLFGRFNPSAMGFLLGVSAYAAFKRLKARVSETAVSVILFVSLFLYLTVNISSIVTVNEPFSVSEAHYILNYPFMPRATGFISDFFSLLSSLSASILIIQSLTEEKSFEY